MRSVSSQDSLTLTRGSSALSQQAAQQLVAVFQE
jgi:hypothetical protein